MKPTTLNHNLAYAFYATNLVIKRDIVQAKGINFQDYQSEYDRKRVGNCGRGSTRSRKGRIGS